MYEIILKARYLNKDYQKALKKILHFLSSYQKQKGSKTSDQSLFRL